MSRSVRKESTETILKKVGRSSLGEDFFQAGLPAEAEPAHHGPTAKVASSGTGEVLFQSAIAANASILFDE